MSECRSGSVRDLEGILAETDPETVVLITGGESFRASGAADAIEPMLASRSVERISGVRPNPTAEDVIAAVEILRACSPHLVVAVGGGSVLDLAKAARRLVTAPDVRRAVLTGEVASSSGPPLVAIPTTAGTGSEATHFSAVYVDGVKYSVGHPSFRPDYVLLDPDLTASMSPRLTAETGLDALAQAMESIWSTRSTDASLEHARAALLLAWANLEDAVHAPSSASRAGMCTAAHLAGAAIDTSKTTAAHALSYAMSVRYGVAHGHAVALTLGALLEHNSGVSDTDCVDPRGAEFVRMRIADVLEIIGARDGAGGRQMLSRLLRSLELETTLSALGIGTPEARREIVESVDAERLANNPRALDSSQLTAIIDAIA
jgi:alcohol dehydrogenase class IV